MYTLEKGILVISSDFFHFEFALCGDFENPQWQLFKAKSYSESKLIEEQLLRRIISIETASKFIDFFGNRKKAIDIFNELEKKSGFYQSFTGSLQTAEFKGYFKNGTFYCDVMHENDAFTFKSPSLKEITDLIKSKKPTSNDKIQNKQLENTCVEFKKNVFGSNQTFFLGNMFYSFSKNESVCFIGEVLRISSVRYEKLLLKTMGLLSFGILGNFHDEELERFVKIIKADVESVAINDSLFANKKEWLEKSYLFINLAYSIKDLKKRFLVSNFLLFDDFYVDEEFRIFSIESRGHDLNLIYTPNSKDVKSKLLDVSNKIRLLSLQTKDLSAYTIMKNEPGKSLLLTIGDINVEFSDKINTNIKALTEDCKLFNVNEAFDYINNFWMFYKCNILPSAFTRKSICFVFSYFVEETVDISVENGLYSITGEKTLQITKIPSVFTAKDLRVFMILYKFFLTDRFICLKKFLDAQDKSETSDVIDLGNDCKISLTQEGIKYICADKEKSEKITLALNTERDVLVYFQSFVRKS